MIDFHSHILPKMDDGSQSCEESIALLEMLSGQNVAAVAATPHFYAYREHSLGEFLSRRKKAYDSLMKMKSEALPSIRLGAEVYYYPGISHMNELPSLCIEETRLLLLEMPGGPWSDSVVRELRELSCRGDVTLLLAHIERYYSYQKRSVWNELRSCGVYTQVNASFFLSFRTRRKAIRMLEDGEIDVIGSDCHNMTSRAPRLSEAAKFISEKCGDDRLALLSEQAEYLWNPKKTDLY